MTEFEHFDTFLCLGTLSRHENRPRGRAEIQANEEAMKSWFRFFSRRKRMMEALDQDIRDFIERETQDNVDRGMSSAV